MKKIERYEITSMSHISKQKCDLGQDIFLTKDEELWLAGAKIICVIHKRNCRVRGWSLKSTPEEFMT